MARDIEGESRTRESLRARDGPTSAFPKSGHSDQQNFNKMTGRFRPEADLQRPFRLIAAHVQLTDENLGEN